MEINTKYFESLLRQAEAEQAQREAEQKAAAPPAEQTEQIVRLNIDLLDDFPAEKNFFRPATPERLEALKSSIQESGILNALLVRKKPNCERYEILAGHNRRTAARLLGWDTIPCVVKTPATEDEAILILNTDNLEQRKYLFPSERGRAYRQIMEAEERRGRPSNKVRRATNIDTAAELGRRYGESRDQVFRYIRLTYLIPPLLDKVDANVLGLVAGGQLSYLTEQAQQAVYTYFFQDNPKEKVTKSLTAKFRGVDSNPDRLLDYQEIDRLVREEKENRNFRKVEVPMKDIRQYFHVGATQQEIGDTILLALEQYFNGEPN